jgi:hypothetical protein
MDLNPGIPDLYQHMHDNHPGQAQGVGWQSTGSAFLCYGAAFEITEQLEMGVSGLTWLDVGSGYGSFWSYLRAAGLDPENYRGVEPNRDYFDTACRHLPDGKFINLSIEDLADNLTPADVVVGIGLLSWYDESEILQIVKKMWDLANKAVVLVWNKNTTAMYTGKELSPLIGINWWVERHDFSAEHGALYLLKD